MMKREMKSNEVRKKIIDATNSLLLEKGYQQTTTREIIKKAGVNNGTLYHFFHDKEEILLILGAKAYEACIALAEKMTKDKHDDILKFTLTRALEFRIMEKYRNAAAIALDIYASWRITKRVLPVDIERNKQCFQKYNKTFTERDYYFTTLAARGMRLSFLSERVNEEPSNFKAGWPFLVESELHLFNVPKAVIERNLEKVQAMISKKSITVRGLKL